MRIEFTRELFTPVSAVKLLEFHNNHNRTLRQSTVLTYARDMVNGRWEETHQCIAFNENGDLIDGQHRLSAVIKSEKNVWFYVARYTGKDRAMQLPIDQNIRRTVADIIGCDRRSQETAAAILRLSSGSLKGVSALEVDDCIKRCSTLIDSVRSVIKSNVRHRTSASARAAIIILAHSMPEYEEEIIEQYKAFAALDFDVMWPSVKALVKLFDLGSVPTGIAGGSYVAHRVYYAFSHKNMHVKIIRIMDSEAIAKTIREASKAIFE